MDSPKSPPELREFLFKNVTSYEQLEVLLLLRDNAERDWSAAVVAETLNVPLAVATETLDQLHQKHLLDVHADNPGRVFRFAPTSAELANVVELLAQTYEHNRLAIVNLMSNNAIERVRTRATRMFADAFIFGRKKDKDG